MKINKKGNDMKEENKETEQFFKYIKKAYDNMTPEQKEEERKFTELLDNTCADGME